MSGGPRPVGQGSGPPAADFYQLVCACGAKLKVRNPKPGRSCTCPRCQRKHRIGDLPVAPAEASRVPVGAPRGAVTAADGKAAAEPATCSACYTAIQPGEGRHVCPACGLIFHEDCWQENLGCSAYGCSQVNALRKGPDLSIPAAVPEVAPLPEAAMALPAYDRPAPSIPWHFLIFAFSAVAGLFSLVTCGVPSLLVGAVALFYTVAAAQRGQLPWLVPALVLSALGFVVGMVLSALIYLVWLT